jgi:outer membrane lipoprotein-sorting protein
MASGSRLLRGLLIVILFFMPSIAHPYILPSTQIIEFMVRKFASVNTLQITQLTKMLDMEKEMEMVFGESISLMSPDLYRSEVAGQPGKRIIVRNGLRTLRIIDGDIVHEKESKAFPFHFLMLAQDSRQLLKDLEELGINLDMVSLTRFGGRIAYLIGNKEEGSPRLLVDKDFFIPLLLQYGNVAFFASDFTELKQRLWFPRYILYSYTGANIEDYIQEEYRIKDIIINPSLDASLFDISIIRSQFESKE